MKRSAWTWAAAVSALVTAGITLSARPRYGGRLYVEFEAVLRGVDPSAPPVDSGDGIARSRLLPLAFETLVAIDPSRGLRPLLATTWEHDQGATKWRFKLRAGVKLHDGTALDPLRAAAALAARSNGWKVS